MIANFAEISHATYYHESEKMLHIKEKRFGKKLLTIPRNLFNQYELIAQAEEHVLSQM